MKGAVLLQVKVLPGELLVYPSSYRDGEEGNRVAEALGTWTHRGWVCKPTGRNACEARASLESEVVSADLHAGQGRPEGFRVSNRPMTAGSLTGVRGVACRHSATREIPRGEASRASLHHEGGVAWEVGGAHSTAWTPWTAQSRRREGALVREAP